MGHCCLDLPGRLDEIDPVARVFFNTRCDSENIRIKDDVRRFESHLFSEYPVRALANFDFAFDGVSLTLGVERHDNDGSAVSAHKLCLLDKVLLAFFEADRIDDGLALYTLQSGFDHRPFRRVNHNWKPRYIRLRGDEAQELHHRILRVEHALIHVDVDDLRAIVHLVASNLDRGSIVVGLNQTPKSCRSRYIAALTHIDEQVIRSNIQRFEPGNPATHRRRGRHSRRQPFDYLLERANMLRPRSATATNQVDQPALCKLLDGLCHVLWRFVILAEFIRQSRIRVRTDPCVRNASEFRDVRPQVICAQCAIKTNHEGVCMADGIPECLARLARQCTP